MLYSCTLFSSCSQIPTTLSQFSRAGRMGVQNTSDPRVTVPWAGRRVFSHRSWRSCSPRRRRQGHVERRRIFPIEAADLEPPCKPRNVKVRDSQNGATFGYNFVTGFWLCHQCSNFRSRLFQGKDGTPCDMYSMVCLQPFTINPSGTSDNVIRELPWTEGSFEAESVAKDGAIPTVAAGEQQADHRASAD